MANMIGEHMETHGVKFIKNCVPLSVEKVSEDPIVLKVKANVPYFIFTLNKLCSSVKHSQFFSEIINYII